MPSNETSQTPVRPGSDALELDPSNSKLMDRFRELGMGDPTQEERIQQAKQRVSEKIQAQ